MSSVICRATVYCWVKVNDQMRAVFITFQNLKSILAGKRS